ncbi:MAG: ABC transporter permease [Burkholderiales bacterium 21-58-4]|nr:MAG: ABC transporter permease [Burkholderiales bacterium 21-58-4]
MVCAVLLDRLLGEPRRWHPLAAFGHYANWLEGRMNAGSARRLRGLLALALALLPCWLLSFLWWEFPELRFFLDVLILYFALGTIPVSIVIALVMALWVNRKLTGRGFLRMAYFTPTVLPMIAVANIWLFFYTPQYGLLAQLGHLLGLPYINWLGSRSTALPAVMAVTVWKEAGFFMIFYLAALQQISPSVREAALLEGASRWQYFWRVLLPLLMPTTVFVLINALINAFRVVDQIVVMTNGGPDNASTLLLFYIYQVGFRFWDTSYAATLTVVLLAILALTALVSFRRLDRKTHYQ